MFPFVLFGSGQAWSEHLFAHAVSARLFRFEEALYAGAVSELEKGLLIRSTSASVALAEDADFETEDRLATQLWEEALGVTATSDLARQTLRESNAGVGLSEDVTKSTEARIPYPAENIYPATDLYPGSE